MGSGDLVCLSDLVCLGLGFGVVGLGFGVVGLVFGWGLEFGVVGVVLGIIHPPTRNPPNLRRYEVVTVPQGCQIKILF